MTQAPLVSVLINNYNYGRFLREAIDSALNQSYPNVEVVVVDDGSTDDSREVIVGYGNRIVTVFKENGGQASAFNAGVAACRGEIVAFLDADDYWFPYAIERVVAAWGSDVANVQFRLRIVDGLGNPQETVNPPRDTPMESGEVWRTLLWRGYYRFPPTSGLSFSRAVLEQVLPVPEEEYRIAADGYLAIVAPFHGRLEAIEEPLGAYRIHGGNLWRQREVEKVGEKFRGFVQHDLLKQELLARKARDMGHEVPRDLGLRHYASLQVRLILLRLTPEKHPVPSDRPPWLAYRGIRAVWLYSKLPWQRKLRLSAWFAWVGLLPLPLARRAIGWLFDSQSRPRVVEILRRPG